MLPTPVSHCLLTPPFVCLVISQISDVQNRTLDFLPSLFLPHVPLSVKSNTNLEEAQAKSLRVTLASSLLFTPTSHHLQILSARSSKYNQHLNCPCCHPIQGISPLTGVPACDLVHPYSLILHTTAGGTLAQCTSEHSRKPSGDSLHLVKVLFLAFRATQDPPPLPVLISPPATISFFICFSHYLSHLTASALADPS